ncbi:MAG: hypothetical protein KC766_23800 [Myxococcales bacterium]|nr:hypothetical protein [Myxococcales bacterium]
MSWMGETRTHRGLGIAALVFLALLACKSNSQKCVAAVQVGDARYSSLGTGATKAEAEKSAKTGSCMAYCDYGDPTIDAAWKRFKATPKGRASKTSKSFDVFLHLKAEKAACMSRCNGQVASGAAATKLECL